MTDRDVLIEIRKALDTAFARRTRGVADLVMLQATTLDDVEVLLAKHGIKTKLKDAFNA